jgi:hypothetical protein
MRLTYVPLLEELRDLYLRPRDMKRFKAYLHMTIDSDSMRVKLPTLSMNPMAKEHVGVFLDAVIALDADRVGADAMREVEPKLRDVPGSFRVALVVCDDVGGWTNRFACEYGERLLAPPPPGQRYNDWIPATLWASEPPSARLVRERVLTALHRFAHVQRHGQAKSLGELMAQEGRVMAIAGCEEPALDPEDIEYTREVIRPFLDATDMRTAVECLYGDQAGATLGFTPRGLSDRASLALALHDARTAEGTRTPSGSGR